VFRMGASVKRPRQFDWPSLVFNKPNKYDDNTHGGVIGSEIKCSSRFEVFAIEIVFNSNRKGRVMERDEVLELQKAWKKIAATYVVIIRV
jgi:hypothetical protein